MLVCSLAPSWYAFRRDPQMVLQAGSRGSTIGHTGGRLRSVMVTAEVALAVILLVGSGLALRSLMHLLEVRPGFNAENLLTMHLTLSPANHKEPKQIVAFHQELMRGLKSVPGVTGVSTVPVLPLSGHGYYTSFALPGRDIPAWKAPPPSALPSGRTISRPWVFRFRTAAPSRNSTTRAVKESRSSMRHCGALLRD